jgi:hypothetical protein
MTGFDATSSPYASTRVPKHADTTPVPVDPPPFNVTGAGLGEPAYPEPSSPEPASPEAASPEAVPDVEPETPEPELEPVLAGTRQWSQHENGRWIVGDAGRQPQIVPQPPKGFLNVPPDTAVDGEQILGLDYRAVSLRGFSHQERAVPRQDAYRIRITPDDRYLVGCVADGVSDGKRSHEAAELVCEHLTRKLIAQLIQLEREDGLGSWEHVVAKLPWQSAVDEANEAIMERASELLQRARDRRPKPTGPPTEAPDSYSFSDARTVMSSTAILFVINTEPDADGVYPAAIANIAGDSSAFRLAGNSWQALTDIKNSGSHIASSTVSPLPGTVTVEPHIFQMPAGNALLVMTDGLGDPIGDGPGPVRDFLATMWATPPDLLAFAQQTGFYRKSFTDDRTAVVVWTRNS